MQENKQNLPNAGEPQASFEDLGQEISSMREQIARRSDESSQYAVRFGAEASGMREQLDALSALLDGEDRAERENAERFQAKRQRLLEGLETMRSSLSTPAKPLTVLEEEWVDKMQREKVSAVAIHVPRWVGVTSATETLFEHLYPFPRSKEIEPYGLGPEEIDRQASILLDSGVPHFIFSGGDEIHLRLARQIKEQNPAIRCDMLSHGSYQHFSEDYAWDIFRLWTDAAREGVVHTIAVVKKGMEEFFQRLGVRSKFLMNYVPEIPEGPSAPLDGGPHLGIWLSSDSPIKKPHVMLSAARMIDGATIHGSSFTPRVREVIEYLDLPAHNISDGLLPRDKMLEAIRATHLSLYVTFSECCPMLPLESLSVGVPCLIGPTSHLFEDNDYLFRRLTVPFPDRAEAIARHIETALEERDKIVEAYIAYAPDYNARARRLVDELLS